MCFVCDAIKSMDVMQLKDAMSKLLIANAQLDIDGKSAVNGGDLGKAIELAEIKGEVIDSIIKVKLALEEISNEEPDLTDPTNLWNKAVKHTVH